MIEMNVYFGSLAGMKMLYNSNEFLQSHIVQTKWNAWHIDDVESVPLVERILTENRISYRIVVG